MAILVRCPQCRVLLKVHASVKPTCPRCGFAGRNPEPAVVPETIAPAWQPARETTETASPEAQAEESWEPVEQTPSAQPWAVTA
jgi:hypothetical protein